MQRLTQLGVVSFGKFLGLVGLCAGILVGIPYGLFVIVLSVMAGFAAEEGGVAAFGVVGGIALMIFLPLFYAVVSFIGGLIYALIINFVLSMIGGLEMRFEIDQKSF